MTEEAIRDCKIEKEEGEQNREIASDEGQYDVTDYLPDFIQKMLDDPHVLPGEKDLFVALFESYEFDYGQRPKTDLEYLLVYQAAMATLELMRYDRMKAAIIKNQQRSAAHSLHRRASAPLSDSALETTARDGAAKFFTDPAYRAEFAAKLEKAGYAANGVEGEAFLRALPSLATIDRLITSTQKRLTNILRQLDAAYATRHPQQPMPRSFAATRSDDVSEMRAEQARKERMNGQREADSSK